jgi:hypothetical protein
MATAWALSTLVRPAGRDQHAFAVVALVCVVGLTLAVGSFTARYTPNGINSRYLFYIAPLLFVGAAALVADRRPATLSLALGGLLTGWVVFGSKLLQAGPSLVSPDQTFHTVLLGRTYQLGNAIGLPHMAVPKLLGVVAIVLAGALLALRRTRHAQAAGAVALIVVGLWCVGETAYSMRKIADTQKNVDPNFISGRRWIDQTLPDGASAPVLLSSFGDAASAMGVWWDTSFWNAKTGRSFYTPFTPDLQQPYPSQFDVNIGTGQLQSPTQATGALGPGPWFVRGSQDRTFGFVGEQVTAERFGVRLVKVATPPRAEWALLGNVDDSGRVRSGAAGAVVHVFKTSSEPEQRRTLTLALATTGDATTPFPYRVSMPGFQRAGRVAPGEGRTLKIPVTIGADGFAEVRIHAPGPETAAGGPPVPGLQVVGVTIGD